MTRPIETNTPPIGSSGMGTAAPWVIGAFGTEHILRVKWASSLEEACACYHLAPFGIPYLELDTFFANGGAHIAMVNLGTTDPHHPDHVPPIPALLPLIRTHAPLSFLLFSATLSDSLIIRLHQSLSPDIDQQQGLIVHTPPPSITDAGMVIPWMETHHLNHKHVAVYFPSVIHPMAQRAVSPVFAVSGLFHRFDHDVGPWRAPSGSAALLHGGVVPTIGVSNEETIALTQAGCNVIRQFKVGTMVWGESTGVGLRHERAYWRYISIRRTLAAIRQHISNLTAWIQSHVDQGQTRADAAEQGRMAIMKGLDGFFKQGGLVGETPESAYMVTTVPTDTGWCWHYGVCLMTAGEMIMTSFELPPRPTTPSDDMV